jgi:hypothetical protein
MKDACAVVALLYAVAKLFSMGHILEIWETLYQIRSLNLLFPALFWPGLFIPGAIGIRPYWTPRSYWKAQPGQVAQADQAGRRHDRAAWVAGSNLEREELS